MISLGIQPNTIVHFGNFLAVCAMGTADMLTLRGFMAGASLCGIVFNLVQPKPLFAPAAWGCFFVCGHTVQVDHCPFRLGKKY